MIVVWLKSGVRTRDNQLDYIAEDNPSAALRIEAAIDRQGRCARPWVASRRSR
ncbi:hypothetical protein [Beijerinckia sp. L45]|uniref:hypothetical protein n=1 Tax=Beijerinckia sp. L45 TaxID=1641855 RepID=UPI00131C2943|nr:hypothetical protein [Beijerinckia sp. L45]